uniref:Putative secreted protein n=1 Tax=Ornithodoros turicata TaxID=34597 RepID=A0A2R5LIH7_9ACAR
MLTRLSYYAGLFPVTTFICVIATVLADTCKLDGGYHYDVLKSAIWRISPPDDQCLGEKPCNWYFQFCNTLPSNLCGVGKSCEEPSKAQFGEFTTLVAEGPHGFLANFTNHTGGNSTCSSFSTNLLFRCDPKKTISIGNDTEVARLHQSGIVTNNQSCVRNITIEFSGACGTATQLQGLSAGSVLLILFFVLLLIYLVIGIVYNHSHGARGWEMIPNYQFWTELPLLIVEGCVFFVKIVTCQQTRSANGTYDNI